MRGWPGRTERLAPVDGDGVVVMGRTGVVRRLGESTGPGEVSRADLLAYLGDAPVDVEATLGAAAMLVRCFAGGGKVLIFGNGGSAACAQHLAAELVGRMFLDRPPLPAIALTADSAVLTALANDFGFEHVFARQVLALGRPGDVALAISTSGHSANVLAAARAARELDLGSIALLGTGASPLGQSVDVAVTVQVPVDAATTARVQEAHLRVQHALCASVERALFGRDGGGQWS